MAEDANTGTPAGWYDDGSGRQRYWNGTEWTAHFADEYQANFGGASGQSTSTEDPRVLWSATGKPLSGIGAGRYKLTSDFLFFEKGALSTQAQQIRTYEIHDVDVNQSMSQKARGVGTITLHAHRARGAEVVRLEDIADFRNAADIINRTALHSRNTLRTKQQTQTVNYSGSVPTGHPQAQMPTLSHTENDLHAQLTKVAELHEAGVLTDDEFASAKAKLLGS